MRRRRRWAGGAGYNSRATKSSCHWVFSKTKMLHSTLLFDLWRLSTKRGRNRSKTLSLERLQVSASYQSASFRQRSCYPGSKRATTVSPLSRREKAMWGYPAKLNTMLHCGHFKNMFWFLGSHAKNALQRTIAVRLGHERAGTQAQRRVLIENRNFELHSNRVFLTL